MAQSEAGAWVKYLHEVVYLGFNTVSLPLESKKQKQKRTHPFTHTCCIDTQKQIASIIILFLNENKLIKKQV